MNSHNTNGRVALSTAIIVAVLLVAVSIGTTYLATKRVEHKKGYDVGVIIGQAQGELSAAQRTANKLSAKNTDINQKIDAAYDQGCEYALNDALTAFGYNASNLSSAVHNKCNVGSTVLPYYNLSL